MNYADGIPVREGMIDEDEIRQGSDDGMNPSATLTNMKAYQHIVEKTI